MMLEKMFLKYDTSPKRAKCQMPNGEVHGACLLHWLCEAH